MSRQELPSEETLSVLQNLPIDSLALHKHTRPPSPPPQSTSNSNLRTSDASDLSASQTVLPALVDAELRLHKEHFSNLRFTYLEQTTKYHFLNALIGDEGPPAQDSEEFAAFNKKLEEDRAKLKGEKAELERVVEEIGKVGREVGDEYEKLKEEVVVVKELPGEIAELKAMLEELGAEEGMPYEETEEEIRRLQAEMESVDRDLAVLERKSKASLRNKDNLARQITTLEKENKRLRNDAEAVAKAKNEQRSTGRVGRDEIGKWYKSSGDVLDLVVG